MQAKFKMVGWTSAPARAPPARSQPAHILFSNTGIGSLVKYKERSICYSKLFAQDDPLYTDQTGNNNDECEYFGNGMINNERFFIQNYVFDATFEIKFNFGEDCLSYGNLTTEFNS